MNNHAIKWDRREILRLAGSLPLAWAANNALANMSTETTGGLPTYLEGLRLSSGGYHWGDFPRTHLSPTFAAIGCYQIIGQSPPDASRVAEYVRTHHPFAIKRLVRELKTFEYQQIQSLLWLGESADAFREKIAGWREPMEFTRAYERHGYPVFEYEVAPVVCRALLGMTVKDLSPVMIAYIDQRRRKNGSFNNTPADDGSDGHIVNTWWGMQALAALGRRDEQRDSTITWTQACQREDGSFTWQPKPFVSGNGDVYYARAAVRVLEQLSAAPQDPESCMRWLLGLRNADGGFAPRPGWKSNPISTYYALDALRALGALKQIKQAPKERPPARPRSDNNLKIFSAQIEAHGTGSPIEAAEMARALKIHLWGAKNAKPGWIEAAQAVANERDIPVTFFVSNEEYGTWVNVPGQGLYSHTSDIIAPAGRDIGQSLAKAGPVSWEVFRKRRLAPLREADGRLVWQFGENEPITRLYLDDSLARGGYAAISTFHFGNPDFINSSPFLMQYRGQIPYVGLQDAHGPESWWWGDQLTGFRTVFLAAKPTWEEWLAALSANRVVAVRRDEDSNGEIWMHGPREVIDRLQSEPGPWRWWNNPAVQRPLASLVAVTPEMTFEAGRPKSGIALRVRCQWENTSRGRPKRPRTALKQLLLDGREVPTKHATPGPRGKPRDAYHLHTITNPAAGEHEATAIVTALETGKDSEHSLRFQA